jgi:hypothetical protein
MSDDEARKGQGASGAGPDSAQTGVELSFSGFIIGLAQQALLSLGLAPESETANSGKDLAHAKAVIDIVAMLREKTRGNLDEVETRLIDEMLDELRLQYVRETRGVRTTDGGGS